MSMKYIERERRPCFWIAAPTAVPGAPTNNSWSLYQNISCLKTPKQEFFVRSEEQIPCPCCEGRLKVIGSRHRRYINEAGAKAVLNIRRLRCQQCLGIHHELPDILVPYKRYDSNSIEAVIAGGNKVAVSADESTLYRWKNWFTQLITYFVGCLQSICIRLGIQSVKDVAALSKSSLQRVWYFVGDAPGWLARVVRPLGNLNLWVHTRSPFLS